jgi:hypothetical protein
MAKSAERLKAIQLRREGKSIKEIAKALCISAGSASRWTQDIELSDAQREYLRIRQIASGHKGRVAGANMNREKRLKRLHSADKLAREDIPEISKKDLFYIGIGLYWGEGTKARHSPFGVTNSDPRIILLMMRWFEECFNLGRDRFRPRVFISDIHREREEVILAYWADALSIPLSQFCRTVFLNKGKKRYENHDRYFGVMALQVAKAAEIRYKVLAKIERVAHLAIDAGVVQELERGTHKP